MLTEMYITHMNDIYINYITNWCHVGKNGYKVFMDSTVNGNNWTQMTVDSNVTNKLFHAMEKSAMGKYAMVAWSLFL